MLKKLYIHCTWPIDKEYGEVIIKEETYKRGKFMGTGIQIKKELILILSFIIWLLCFIVKIIKENKKIDFQTVKSALLKLALIEYLALLIGVTLFPIRISNIPNNITPVINLNIVSIFDYGFNKYAFINIAGNILLLAPLPILLYFNGYNKKLTI